MPHAKLTITDDQAEFLNQFAALGYPDKSSLAREALERFRNELAQKRLRESADLYAEVYSEDENLQQLTSQAMKDWPE